MIDLSHLTEEEQEAIMTVLSRDAELKRAEEERIRYFFFINLKYFTGEWFYEAKSSRHMDKIHGSELILASIKRRKSALGEILNQQLLIMSNKDTCFDKTFLVQMLNYIDKSDQQVQAKTKQELRLSSQTTSPNGEKDDSITKVLDWFSRSTDSSNWLNNNDEKITKSSSDVHNQLNTEATGKSHVPIEIHKQQDTLATAPPPLEDNSNENQHAKISHLKSFWEKSNSGNKIFISKSITSSDKESKTSKDEEHRDSQSTASIHNDMGVHKDVTNQEKTDKTQQKETHSMLQSLTAPGIQLEKISTAPLFAPTIQPNGISQVVEHIQSEEINKKEKRIPESQVQAKDNLESDKLVHLKPNGQISPKVQIYGSNEDMNRRNYGDRSPKSAPIKDKSPVLNRHVGAQDVPLKDKERIKHLKSFWEQERAKTGYIVKTRADLKSTSAKLNKRHMSKSVPSFLQKELSGSVMTMYSGDFGSVEVQGTIHFSIHYVQKLREFHIFVAQCKDLATVDPKRGRSDPYVKSYLVPDKANLGKRKTSVKKKTHNPVFNEILRYRVRMEYLKTQTLILSVWHHDTFGKNSFLGEIDVDLSKWDFDHTQMNYLALKARTYPTLTLPNCRGEMRIAIRYVPQIVGPNSGEIHIWVKECKNLPMIRATIDPYVKCFVLPDTSKKSRQKTRVLRGTTDPVFNHTMVYDGIRQADLTEACVELTVLDRDRLATNLLGGLRLGAGTGRSYGSLVDWMDSTAYEVALWDRMMASPNEWVEDVLPLRWLHSTKTTSK
uniref:Synaptotagmin-like protein 2 n=1 Tax=Periophthalmus magnuspinnatus TaxID=409849 RepID=A0A3B4AAJ2_9GOBI